MKTVMLFGTFDVLHLGHIDLFAQAKALGEKLIVVVSRDARAAAVKGKAPRHTEAERLALVSHIDLVDEAVLGDEHDVYRTIERYAPHVIALGYDQEAFTAELDSELQRRGISVDIVRLKPYQADRYKSSLILTNQ